MGIPERRISSKSDKEQQYHYLLIKRGEHPNIYVDTIKGCQNYQDRETCFQECDKDETCKEVWSYDNGRCCMKQSSDKDQGWRTIINGGYYEKVNNVISVQMADIDSDGDLDVLSASGDKVVWYENTALYRPHFLHI